MDRQTLKTYGTDNFTENLQSLAEFETQWRTQLRPDRVSSELILPEPSFSPLAAKDIWKRVTRVTVNHDNISKITALIKHFQKRHRKGKLWRDKKLLDFDPFGPRHGRIEKSKRWKFTYLVDEGFHYDVKHSRQNTSFTLKDAEGKTHSFPKYANVDCHGFIRGRR